MRKEHDREERKKERKKERVVYGYAARMSEARGYCTVYTVRKKKESSLCGDLLCTVYGICQHEGRMLYCTY